MEGILTNFNSEKFETNVDFIAWTVAKMEFDKRPISASAVSGNMNHIMAEQFYIRLNYFRSLLQEISRSSQDGISFNDTISLSVKDHF